MKRDFNHAANRDKQDTTATPTETSPPRTLGEIQVSTDETTLTLKLDALAALGESGSRSICVLSVAGAHTAVKALHACLHGAGNRPTFSVNAGRFKWERMIADAAGYETWTGKLPGCYGWWQMVAIAKREGLLPIIDDAALWREFKSARYATPILRPWVPFVRDTLLQGKRLVRLAGFQCHAGLLTVTPEELDIAVCSGMEFGALEME